MNRRRDIALSDAEVQALLAEERTLQVASIGRDGQPHLVPMWFTVVDGQVVFWTYGKSQKILNLRRDPRITCLVEAGEAYGELRGVQLQGRARLVEDPAELLAIGERLYERYGGALTASARETVARNATKRVGVVVEVERAASWDHRK